MGNKTKGTHALVAALAAEPIAFVADPSAPVTWDTTEEAPDVALCTAPDAPLEAADAPDETPLEAIEAPELAALCAPVTIELAPDMAEDAPLVALLDAPAIADDALALAEAGKKVAIVSKFRKSGSNGQTHRLLWKRFPLPPRQPRRLMRLSMPTSWWLLRRLTRHWMRVTMWMILHRPQ